MAEDADADKPAEPFRRMPQVPKPPRESITIEGEPSGPTSETAVPATPTMATSSANEAPKVASESAAAGGAKPGGRGPSAPEPAKAAETAAASPRRPPPPPPRAGSSFGWGLSGALIGGLIGAGLAVGGFWVYGPWEGPLSDVSTRQNALEAASSAESAATKSIEGRLAALESAETGLAKAAALAALQDRLAKLEASAVKPDALAATAMDARAAHDAANKALALAVATAAVPTNPPGAPAPDPRVTKLVADSAVLADRIARLEATLDAPKSETRAPSAELPPKDDSAAKAIAAIALEQRLRSGEPFAPEFAALSRLGADAARLSSLQPYAESGIPTASALDAAFAKVAPAVREAANPETNGGDPVDKLLDHMTRLVRVHAVGEVIGGDPDALVSQVAAALSRDQAAAALKIFAELPEPARKAAGDWPAKARARAGADAAEAAARALREGAIAELAAPKT